MSDGAALLHRLLTSVLWGLECELPGSELVPMLEHLLREAPTGSDEARLARSHLARLTVAEQPWRALRLARTVLEQGEGDDHVCWAVIGLAHTLLGNYRSARRAYDVAVALAPDHPSYQHNLGHLLDVAFDRPVQALYHLRAAFESMPEEAELAASYAHALVRAGRVAQAERILRGALGERADGLLAEWLLAAQQWHETTVGPRRTKPLPACGPEPLADSGSDG